MSTTTSKKLIRNTIFNVVTLVCNAAVSFLLIRFFLGRLGEAHYGLWVLVGSLFQYRGIFSLGLNSSINRYVPIYLAKNDNQSVQRVVSTALLFYCLMAIVCAALSFLLYRYIGSWFTIEPELIGVAATLVLIVGLLFAVAMPVQLSSAILAGLQRYDIVSITILVTLTLRTFLLVILLLRGYGLLTMGLVFGISEITVRALQIFFVRRLLPKVSISFKGADLRLLREMAPYGINTLLYTTGAIIAFKTSDVINGIFLGTSQVSRFAVAAAAVLLLTELVQAFGQAVMPAVSDLSARNDHSRVKEIALLTQKYSLLLIIPSACFFIVMGKEFLWIWVGEKFKDRAVTDFLAVVLTVLTVGHSLRLAQHSNFLVLVGRGQHRFFGISTALMTVLCILGCIISLKVFDLGLMGVAWSNFVPMALISGLILPIYFNRKMHISSMESLHDVWWPALCGSLPAVIVIILWKYISAPDCWSDIAAVVFTAGALTLAGSWIFSLSSLERKRFWIVLLRRGKLRIK